MVHGTNLSNATLPKFPLSHGQGATPPHSPPTRHVAACSRTILQPHKNPPCLPYRSKCSIHQCLSNIANNFLKFCQQDTCENPKLFFLTFSIPCKSVTIHFNYFSQPITHFPLTLILGNFSWPFMGQLQYKFCLGTVPQIGGTRVRESSWVPHESPPQRT